MVTFRRILVAWDGSDAAEAALLMAASYADAVGATVEALTVFDGRSRAGIDGAFEVTGPEYERVTTRFQARFGDGRIPFHAVASSSNPGQVIAQYADDRDFDLIAVGRPAADESGDHDHAVPILKRQSSATVLVVSAEGTAPTLRGERRGRG